MSGAADDPVVEVDVLVTGQLTIPRAYLFPEAAGRLARIAAIARPGGEAVASQCLAYVVRHPSGTAVVIDTGFHRDAGKSLRKDLGVPMALVFGRALRVAEEPYDEALRGLGIDPGKVERAIMTHLHVDHTSGMRLLPNARFICSRREWAAARTRGAAARGYVAGHLPGEEQVELVDFDSGSEPYGPFGSTFDLFGDGSIRLVSTPGHTPGHMSVLLRVVGGRQLLVVGDAVYTLRSLREEIVPLLTAGGEKSYRRSLRELKAFSDQNPQAILVPSHDPAAWHELRDLTASAERAIASGE